MAYVYMLLCRDGSIYTGTARDLQKRMRDHFERTRAVAAYTRAKGAKRLLGAWECDSLPVAMRAEYAIKRLTRREKETLLAERVALTAERFPCLGEAVLMPLADTDARMLAVRIAYLEETEEK